MTLSRSGPLLLLGLLLQVDIFSSPTIPAVDAVIDEYIDAQEISGAVTMALHEGECIHFSARGLANREQAVPMQTNTLFRIASLTKNFSAVLIKLLEEEGTLKVTDKVETHLPEFKNLTLKDDDGKGPVDLRIWHLMTHTSGVDVPSGYHNTSDLAASAKAIASRPLLFRPGTKWKYSKGMDVCGHLVEVLSGKPFEVLLEEKICEPLGLADTSYNVGAEQAKRLAVVYQPNRDKTGLMPGGHPFYLSLPYTSHKPNPSSGLFSSTKDVATYFTMLLNGGVHQGTRILSADSVADLTRNWTGGMKTNPIEGVAWGLGFGVVRTPSPGVTAMLSSGTYGHGGAYGNQAWVDPKTKTIYLLMIQRKGFGNGDMAEIRERFQAVVAETLR